MTRSNANAFPDTGRARCATCPDVEGTWRAIARHQDEAHGGAGRIEAVLEQTVDATTPVTAGGTQASASVEDRGSRSRAEAAPASSPERPSDDNRQLYAPPAELSRTPRVKPRASASTPGRPVGEDLPKTATPEERKLFTQKVRQLKKVVEEHRP